MTVRVRTDIAQLRVRVRVTVRVRVRVRRSHRVNISP